MKKILFAALALIVVMASCVKDPKYPGVTISNLSYSPIAVQDMDDVTVSATIASFDAFTAKLVYTVAEAAPVEVDMVSGTEKDVFTAVIPGQPDGTTVSFYVKVDGTLAAQSPAMEYTVGAVAIDYSGLRLNELNGNKFNEENHNGKFIEIYNAGNEAISMKGVYIEKDGAQNWVGDNTVTVEAGGYLVLYSEDIAENHQGLDSIYFFHSGLSNKKNVRIQLFTPAGESIDDFNLVDIDLNGEAYGYAENQAPASYSRNADGNWYYADATPGAANVDGENIVLGLEGGVNPEPPTPEEPSYNNLILNELNGKEHKKFIEIFNTGNEAVDMEGLTIVKDSQKLIWTGKSGVTVEPGDFLLLFSEDVFGDYPNMDTTFYMFHSGLSDHKNVRIELKNPEGENIDDFNLTNINLNGEAYGYLENAAPDSYSRNADGVWYYSVATPAAVNVDGENPVLGLTEPRRR